MRKFSVTVVVLVIIVALLLINAVRKPTLQPEPLTATSHPVDAQASATRLAGALKIATHSHTADPATLAPFNELEAYLRAQYPHTHQTLKVERIGDGGLLYTWPGRDPSLPAVLLTAHLDVVPADDAALWQQPPFGGVIKDGFIWGRGALDDKVSALGILEAVEPLAKSGYQPQRTLLLAFGWDEEIGGHLGAEQIANTLKARGTKVSWLIDEGGALLNQSPLPAKGAIATIGIAEKGYASVALDAEAHGGHSSMPTTDSAIMHLSLALQHLQAKPYPARISGVTGTMFDWLTPDMPLGYRMIFGNRTVFGRVLAWAISRSPSGNALLRTTQAPTIIQAGSQDNVIPSQAHAVINLRLLPGETPDAVLARFTEIVKDPQVKLSLLPGARASSPISPVDTDGFRQIAGTIRGVFPGTTVAPYLVVGATDARHYEALTPNIYRFLPVPFGPDDLKRFHGRDERIAIKDYADTIRYYDVLIQVGTRE